MSVDGNSARQIDDPEREGSTESPNIPALMAEIRAKVAADVDANRDKRPAFQPLQASSEASARKAGELLYSEELRYLNSNYAFGPNLNLDSISSHRPGFIGKIIVRAKRKLLTLVWDLLKDYFGQEREFHANLVRFLNDTSKYVDARDASNFWELIRKIDYDVTKALTRIERISDEQMASLRTSERRIFDSLDSGLKEILAYITELQGAKEQSKADLQTLKSVTSGLEGIIARLGKANGNGTTPTGAISATPHEGLPDYSYLLLENRYRGSEDEIQRRVSIYPQLFKDASKPVLEIGPGRGELQKLFRSQSIPTYGIEIDAAMVEICRNEKLDVRLEDGLAHLQSLPDRSIGGVIAIQVVEHLKRQELEAWLELCSQKVVSGGRIVFETIDPRSLVALSSHYFRDPTHVFPQHPDTLAYAMTLAGLEVEEIRNLSPFPEEAKLKAVPIEPYMTPRWSETIAVLNRNISQINNLLYGFQDFCVIAKAR